MSTKFYKQFIYCNEASQKNFPQDLTSNALISGSAFTEYTPIVQLGIQAPPGTKFYINGNTQPVIIGYTGLFDLDLLGNGSILSLKFDKQSVDNLERNDYSVIIVDILYLGGN